jgi:hypothetical protein
LLQDLHALYDTSENLVPTARMIDGIDPRGRGCGARLSRR